MSKGRVCIVELGYAQEDPYSDPGVRTAREQRCRCCGRPFIRDSPFCCNPCAVTQKQRELLQRVGYNQASAMTFNKYSAVAALNFFWNRREIESFVR